MNLFNQFGRKQTEAYVDSLAREIAKRVQATVWDRVRDDILSMPIAEARGYARARAAAVVRCEVAMTLENHVTLEAWSARMLSELSLERTVHSIITDLVAGGPWARRAVSVPVQAQSAIRRAA